MIKAKSSPLTAPISTAAAEAYARSASLLSQNTTLQPTLRFAYGSDHHQQFEIYEPPGVVHPPVLVFFHGGAWTHGGLEWLRFMAPAVVSLPAVFIAASYRLAPHNKWPAAYEDACEVLKTVYNLSKQRGYDQRRIVLGGHSAGGHLAALVALRGRFDWLHYCFPVSSRFDLRTANPKPGSGEERVYRYVLQDQSQDADASPLLFVSGNKTPFHIIWGDQDFERVANSSRSMVDALQAAGTSVSSNIVKGADHFDTHLQLLHADNPWYTRLKQELQSC